MRLSVTLPPKCERKWKRIAAYMREDGVFVCPISCLKP